MPKRWGRLDDENRIVEFTYENPEGRFHPSLIWVEVDQDTKWGTKITVFGSEEEYEETESKIDLDALFYEEQKQYEERMNKLETKTDKDPVISDYTINSVPVNG